MYKKFFWGQSDHLFDVTLIDLRYCNVFCHVYPRKIVAHKSRFPATKFSF